MMMKYLVSIFLIVSLSFFSINENDDKALIENVIIQLFDGMRENDRHKVSETFYKTMQLSTVRVREGVWEVVYSDHNQFLEAISQPKAEVWDEQYSDLNIQVSGHLATAWMNYTFYRGEHFSHCGVNTINFIKTSVGWKMFSITDTRRSEIC